MKYLSLIAVCFLLHLEISAQGKLTSYNCSSDVVTISKEMNDSTTKLKATLLKNLIKDKLIVSEDEIVELDFLHNKVLFNEQEMTIDRSEKYIFILKGLGFRLGDRYLIHLRPDTMSLKAYSRTGKILQELLVEEGSWTSSL